MAYLDDRISLIETVPDAFVDAVSGLREEIFKRLVRVIAQFDTDGGQIVLNEANILRIDQLIEELDGFLFEPESEYLKALSKFVAGIGESAALTNEFLGVRDSPLYKQMLRQNQFNVIKLFDKTSVNSFISNSIQRQITASVAEQGKVADTIDFLRKFVGGMDYDGQGLTRWVKTQALTAYGTADAAYVVTVGKNEGIDKWLYAGGLVKDSRPFCVKRDGNVYTTAEVLKWPEEEQKLDNYPWQGMIAGTNASNIFTVRGGWNCRHILMPVT